MKAIAALFIAFILQVPAASAQSQTIALFDGKTFSGWEGDTTNTWRIEGGALVGGSLVKAVPHNEFIATTKSFSNYVLRLKFKLTGHEGFINGGVQFHSQRIKDPAYEMTGYQADIGDGYWGSLYDESRRNKLLAVADTAQIKWLLRPNDWNDYEIRTEGKNIRIFLNGEQTVAYTEKDATIPQSGLIAFQVHGGGKVQVHYKDIFLQKIKKQPHAQEAMFFDINKHVITRKHTVFSC